MTSVGYDPHLLQQNAQAQLQAALRNHLPSADPNSNKRQSSPEPPLPKRAAVSRPSSPGDQSLHGFTRIPLPSPPLSRASSDLIPSREINNLNSVNFSNFPAAASSSATTRLPEESSGDKSAAAHSLYRSSSAPIPEYHLPAPASTPPRPPAAGKVAPLPPTPSPEAKRAKRIQERIIQMKKLWDEVMEEEEEDDAAAAAASQNAHHCPHNDGCEVSNASGTEKLCDDPVWVEMRGENRILHLKCHCNKAYQILLSGNDCYYKL